MIINEGQLLIVSTLSGSLVAVDQVTGTVLWTRNERTFILNTDKPVDQVLYIIHVPPIIPDAVLDVPLDPAAGSYRYVHICSSILLY